MNPRVLDAFPDARLGRDDWYLATCPAHTDEHPSLGFRQMDDGWVAFKCRSQGCARDVILEAAGLALVDIGPERPATNGQRKPDHEAKRWRVGEWLHIRYEDAEGHKTRVPWAFVDGSLCPSGKGPRTAELPLYGAEFLADLADGATVYVAEGEKSADALRWAGLIGLATVTGADGMPCDDSLRPLLRFCVRLWPDNDANGARHMERIATRLAALGCRQIQMVRWPDAPEKGDAADLLRPFAQAKDSNGATDALEALPLKAWTRPAPTPTKGVDSVVLVSAADLEHMLIPEPRYAVPGLLVAGLCLLASKPKVGKSWLALDVAIAAASGGKALGAIDIPEAGDVLYLALEDTRRRLQTRMRRLLIEKFPPRLSFALEWPKLDAGGVTKLEEWLEQHPDARLVVIDVWKRVRQARRKGADPYSEDYEHLVELKTLADRFDVTILVIHHTRKAEAADVLDEVNATTGASGACDSVLILHRSRTAADAELWIIGRDLEDGHKALSFDKGIWTLLGESSEVTRSSQRQEVIDTINAVNGGLAPVDVADALGKPHGAIRSLIWKMVLDGELEKTANTKYVVALMGTGVTAVDALMVDSEADQQGGQHHQCINGSSTNARPEPDNGEALL